MNQAFLPVCILIHIPRVECIERETRYMKGKLTKMGLAAALVAFSASAVFAQTQMGAAQQPNSIRPGEVNYIEGQVALNGTNLESSSLRSTVIQPGDDLTTGQGYAEVLLTPGAFLRIGNDSEIRLGAAGLVNTHMTLVRGSALVEAADVLKGSTLDLTLGSSTAQIEAKGLYAFDASSQTVKVLQGKLKVTDTADRSATLRKGDQVILSSDHPLKRRDFNAKSEEREPLYVWSKVRSHDEAEATMNVADEVANSGGWYGPGWYWDPAWSFYAFAPGAGYLGGPFGWNYYSPVFLYGGGYWGQGFYGRGFYGGHYAAGLRGYTHEFSGMHAMSGGGFHGGGGRR
jgi:hypothetical protein